MKRNNYIYDEVTDREECEQFILGKLAENNDFECTIDEDSIEIVKNGCIRVFKTARQGINYIKRKIKNGKGTN